MSFSNGVLAQRNCNIQTGTDQAWRSGGRNTIPVLWLHQGRLTHNVVTHWQSQCCVRLTLARNTYTSSGKCDRKRSRSSVMGVNAEGKVRTKKNWQSQWHTIIRPSARLTTRETSDERGRSRYSSMRSVPMCPGADMGIVSRSTNSRMRTDSCGGPFLRC